MLRSGRVMDCHAMVRGSIPGGNGVFTELHVIISLCTIYVLVAQSLCNGLPRNDPGFDSRVCVPVSVCVPVCVYEDQYMLSTYTS